MANERKALARELMSDGQLASSTQILDATTPTQIAAVRELFLEYAQSLGFSLCFQSFDQELASLPGKYSPPQGALLFAEVDSKIVGCVALRPLPYQETICEMKRLYVRPAYRGLGLGRQLAISVIRRASKLGYGCMRLDTVAGKMDEAIALYRRLGFCEISPYTENPIRGALYMELRLT
jgi:ribosomal protein S18 acetylase RimI-like enzyme